MRTSDLRIEVMGIHLAIMVGSLSFPAMAEDAFLPWGEYARQFTAIRTLHVEGSSALLECHPRATLNQGQDGTITQGQVGIVLSGGHSGTIPLKFRYWWKDRNERVEHPEGTGHGLRDAASICFLGPPGPSTRAFELRTLDARRRMEISRTEAPANPIESPHLTAFAFILPSAPGIQMDAPGSPQPFQDLDWLHHPERWSEDPRAQPYLLRERPAAWPFTAPAVTRITTDPISGGTTSQVETWTYDRAEADSPIIVPIRWSWIIDFRAQPGDPPDRCTTDVTATYGRLIPTGPILCLTIHGSARGPDGVVFSESEDRLTRFEMNGPLLEQDLPLSPDDADLITDLDRKVILKGDPQQPFPGSYR